MVIQENGIPVLGKSMRKGTESGSTVQHNSAGAHRACKGEWQVRKEAQGSQGLELWLRKLEFIQRE